MISSIFLSFSYSKSKQSNLIYKTYSIGETLISLTHKSQDISFYGCLVK